LPLTAAGRNEAIALGKRLAARRFARVFTSPMRRARETCELAGFGDVAVVDEDLHEWDYGIYEGRTLAEVRVQVPSWSVWDGPTPEGESAADVWARANRVIATLHEIDGDVLIFAHGHFLRALGARWVGLAADDGRRFRLDTATLSTLGYERGTPVILSWNALC
jgi:probable phosphoglycerate mutase